MLGLSCYGGMLRVTKQGLTNAVWRAVLMVTPKVRWSWCELMHFLDEHNKYTACIKFERADGTWAAAPGLDIRRKGCGLRHPRPPSGSTASRNGGCRVYSNMTLSPAVDAWGGYSRASPARMECDGGREPGKGPGDAFLPGKIGCAPLKSTSRNAGALRSEAVRNARTALTSEVSRASFR